VVVEEVVVIEAVEAVVSTAEPITSINPTDIVIKLL
jgi:hypothetical protein